MKLIVVYFAIFCLSIGLSMLSLNLNLYFFFCDLPALVLWQNILLGVYIFLFFYWFLKYINFYVNTISDE